ncbi:MAG: hypothetical protein OXQ94_16360 [Gemmatimonadota bacterium]|nr:hypothetical protein [Gemmatimonadota bacterium]MDE2873252.1 hypothetical protein [Gemmatimonadota bacterium]
MKTLFALTLAVTGLFATVATPTASATEALSAISATTTPEVPPLPVAELCEAGLLPASSGPCTLLGRRLAVSAAVCAASTFGFIKAIRMARAAAAAVRAGEGFLAGFFGGMSILFCWDVYDTYWEWAECRSGGAQHYTNGISAAEEELADLLDSAADELEAGRLPEDPENPGLVRH